MPLPRPLLFALLLLLVPAFAFPQNLSRSTNYEKVSLEKPARLTLAPAVDGPLLRGQPMQFVISLSGAPKPINMWSARIDYTTGTLTFQSLRTPGKENEVAVVISDPYSLKPGIESRSLAGISLPGWQDAEMVQLMFMVSPDAPAEGTLELQPHPTIREGLAHDSVSEGKTYDFERVLDSARCRAMKVVDVSEEHQPYEFPTNKPRVLFSVD